MQNRIWRLLRRVPGWLVIWLVTGLLYLTGLHTEVIGQLQRVWLRTGIIQPKLPVPSKQTRNNRESALVDSKLTKTSLPLTASDFQLKSLNGALVSLEAFKGKVLFINFWATWCPPCIAEMPNIQSLYEKLPPDKFAFIMVSVDEDTNKAQAFISRKNFTFPVYTPAGPVPQVFAGNVIPSTFIISPDNKLVLQHQGMADYDNREFRNFLIQLAQTPASK